MDSKRFDNWTRNRALRLSRRDALRLVCAGGAAAALPARAVETLAQGSCSLTIHAQTDGGPSASNVYDGTLQFAMGADGTFTQASYTPTNGGALQASGAANGRAIDFVISLSANQTLAFSGAGEQPFSICQGAAAGTFAGPQPGDLGAWQSTGSSSGSSGSSAPPIGSGQSTGGGGSTSGSTSGGGGSTSGGSNGGGGGTTNCPSPQIACGQNCCPGGGICTDANQGLCSCPSGTTQCGVNCVPSCPDDQTLDLDSCTCFSNEPACIDNGNGCANHGQCCSGYCAGGTCQSCGGKVCGDFGCIDPSRDSQNCGNCGVVCVAPQGLCLGGVCGCLQIGDSCSFDSDCCTGECNQGFCDEIIH
jgi:hypothetical protein